MEIPLQTTQPIFQNSHRLSKTEWGFVRGNCQKLLELGMIRKSDSNHYASATVVVRKKDEEGTTQTIVNVEITALSTTKHNRKDINYHALRTFFLI